MYTDRYCYAASVHFGRPTIRRTWMHLFVRAKDATRRSHGWRTSRFTCALTPERDRTSASIKDAARRSATRPTALSITGHTSTRSVGYVSTRSNLIQFGSQRRQPASDECIVVAELFRRRRQFSLALLLSTKPQTSCEVLRIYYRPSHPFVID